MDNQLAVRSMDDIERAAMAMYKSGYFSDVKDVSQAAVKIMAGQEMGFGTFASITGIYIIQGRPSIGANLMAAAIKGSRRYNYRVMEMTDTACEIAFFEDKVECGRSRFTIEDAKKAKTKNLETFPRNMLFARAISNGCRWYCPDVFNGAPTYTPEELGANVNEAGDVIDAPCIISAPLPQIKSEPAQAPQAAPSAPQSTPAQQAVHSAIVAEIMPYEDTATVATSDGKPYRDIDQGTLVNMANSITAKLLKHGYTTDEKTKEAEHKLSAIRSILAHDAQGKDTGEYQPPF